MLILKGLSIQTTSGYRFIFEDGQDRKTFTKDGLKIQVHLKLYTEDKNKLSEGYKAYWFDNPKDIVDGINCHNLGPTASYYLVGFRTLRCGAPCPSGHLTGGYVARSRSHIPGTLGESALYNRTTPLLVPSSLCLRNFPFRRAFWSPHRK